MAKQIIVALVLLTASGCAQTAVLLDGQPAVRCDGGRGPLTIYRTMTDGKPSFHVNALEINAWAFHKWRLTIAADTIAFGGDSGQSFTAQRSDLSWAADPTYPVMTLTANAQKRRIVFATETWNKPLLSYSACMQLAYKLIVAFPDGATEFDRLTAPLTASHQPSPEPPKPTVAVLKVTSHPGSAQVYLDGVFKGQTDDDGNLLVESSPGDHELRIDRADYKEWKGKVTLTGGRTEQSVGLVRRGPEPLSFDEVDQALTQGITPKRCAELVEQYGVNFSLTPDVDKRLRSEGADDALLVAIAENKR